jgi:hypothetical protein
VLVTLVPRVVVEAQDGDDAPLLLLLGDACGQGGREQKWEG